ncbi:unnamed protein product [Prorocentrum cordatum]|uniref:Uncharacterized protein n=1 Tax=Prorocentrum cordatum TaxID=2364126 RepID=A0ABN9TZF1_9DINO|nr:unnamed protein product [Polarella glacialis]
MCWEACALEMSAPGAWAPEKLRDAWISWIGAWPPSVVPRCRAAWSQLRNVQHSGAARALSLLALLLLLFPLQMMSLFHTASHPRPTGTLAHVVPVPVCQCQFLRHFGR